VLKYSRVLISHIELLGVKHEVPGELPQVLAGLESLHLIGIQVDFSQRGHDESSQQLHLVASGNPHYAIVIVRHRLNHPCLVVREILGDCSFCG